MDEMKAVDLGQVMSSIRASGRPNTVLWQAPDSIAFVARGREFRSEFHSDPSDEVMYMIKGDMGRVLVYQSTPFCRTRLPVTLSQLSLHVPDAPHPHLISRSWSSAPQRKRTAAERSTQNPTSLEGGRSPSTRRTHAHAL